MLPTYFLLLCGLVLTLPCSGQQGATILGSVQDTEGKAIANATLAVTGVKTGEQRLTRSSGDGSFVIPAIPADTYQIAATCDNCSDSSTSVTVASGQSRRVEIRLHTDSATTLVAVDTQATTLETTSNRLGTNITAAETAELPVNGRTYAPLTLTAAGVMTGATATFDDIHFNGQSGEQNNIRLDGIDASSVVSASPGFSQVPGFLFRLQESLDSIEELRIDSALYPASEGRGSGGQIELVSKSGSDQWHAALSEYLRNDELDARNFFDQSENNGLHMNQVGGSVGGSLVKSKLFLFASSENLLQRVGFTSIEQVPSELARGRGDLAAQQILTGIPLGSATADPDVNTAARSGSAQDNEATYSLRLDYLLSAKDRVFVRESHVFGNYEAPDDTTAPRFVSSGLRSDQLVLNWSRIATANTINQFTGGFEHSVDRLAISTNVAGIRGILVDFGSGLVKPGSLLELPVGFVGTGADFAGLSGQAGDQITVLHGAHTLLLGGETRLLRVPFSTQGGTAYSFQNADSFLRNSDADIQSSGDVTGRTAVQDQFSGFVQDDWRIAPTVQLNLGVRYEYYSATREVDNRATLLNPYSLTFSPAQGGFYPTSTTGFSPRVGLSWTPGFSTGHTVIRVGGGSYQALKSIVDTLLPIENDAKRFLVTGSRLPVANPSAPSSANSVGLPTGLDASSFRKLGMNYQFGLSVQQVLPGKFVAQAAYVGSEAHHLEQWTEANPITGVRLSSLGGVDQRADNALGAVRYLTNGGNSSYNALDLNLTRRLVDSLTMSASLDWSHSIGDSVGSGDGSLPQDPTCLACERGDNDFDVRRTFSVNALYDLPFGSHGRYLRSGWRGKLIGNWSAGAIWNARTGLPINVTVDRPNEIYFDPISAQYYSSTRNLPPNAVTVLNTPGGGETRPALRPNLKAGFDPYIQNSNGQWLNPDAFEIPLPGTFGSLGRNALRGPGFSQLDVQLSRRFFIRERQSIVVRVEAFNICNHTNFANPSSNLPDALIDIQPGQAFNSATAPGFGQLVSTVGRTVGLGAARQLQVGLRYGF